MSAALRASHTHLYPGARLRGDDLAPRRGQPLSIEFSDLGAAEARIETVTGVRLTLVVGPHRTAKGTPIEAKRWLVDASTQGEWRLLRRLAKDG